MLLRLISVRAIIVGALSALPGLAGAQDAIVTGCLTQDGADRECSGGRSAGAAVRPEADADQLAARG
jgi:hypothetical protein